MPLPKPVAAPKRNSSKSRASAVAQLDLDEIRKALAKLKPGEVQPIGDAFHDRQVMSGERKGQTVTGATQAGSFGAVVRDALTEKFPDEYLVKGGRKARGTGKAIDTSRIRVQSYAAEDGDYAVLSLKSQA